MIWVIAPFYHLQLSLFIKEILVYFDGNRIALLSNREGLETVEHRTLFESAGDNTEGGVVPGAFHLIPNQEAG